MMINSKLCFYPLMHVLVFVTLALSGVRKMKLTVVFSCQKRKKRKKTTSVDSHCSTKRDNTQNNANIVARPKQEAGSYSTNKQYRKINHLAFSWQVSPRSEVRSDFVYIYIYGQNHTELSQWPMGMIDVFPALTGFLWYWVSKLFDLCEWNQVSFDC